MALFKRSLRLNLALQGGGAHGAFTWGVLDRLLEDDTIAIGWVSATSAGAVNAVALAAGLAEGGRPAAKAKLREVWTAVVEAGVNDLMRLNPFLYSLTRSAMSHMTTLMSPYEFNPMGFDPLRRLLERTIDFAAIRDRSPVELLIAATEVATGKPRLFRRQELHVEQVLASACLPTLHRAVTIGDTAYWDGGYSANPDIVTLAAESPACDTLLVMLNPVYTPELPTGAREIQGHINRLTFNAPLRRDVELIAAMRSEGRRHWSPLAARNRFLKHRFHVIEAGRFTAGLKPDSKMKPDAGLITYLHGAGRTEAHKWLERHRADIGRRETADLAARLLRSGAAHRKAQSAADSALTGIAAAPSAVTPGPGGANAAAPASANPSSAAATQVAAHPPTRRA
ncbi:MAG: patatin-like phospholipase family protein [Hyphomicrobiaceae bacterium]